MKLALRQLYEIMPHGGGKLPIFLPHLQAAMDEFNISTEANVEMFLATVAHESNDLLAVQENLNYSAVGLCRTWPSRFPTLADAKPFARNPEKIANRVYANRMGNGDEASGDGWRYRGAGLIQLTGKDNHARCAKHFGRPVETFGDWLRTPQGAARSAAWFWATNGCNELAEKGDFDGVCDKVNFGRKTARIGDSIGYADRLASLHAAQSAI